MARLWRKKITQKRRKEGAASPGTLPPQQAEEGEEDYLKKRGGKVNGGEGTCDGKVAPLKWKRKHLLRGKVTISEGKKKKGSEKEREIFKRRVAGAARPWTTPEKRQLGKKMTR